MTRMLLMYANTQSNCVSSGRYSLEYLFHPDPPDCVTDCLIECTVQCMIPQLEESKTSYTITIRHSFPQKNFAYVFNIMLALHEIAPKAYIQEP